jgi:hypothetical protein
MPFTVQARGRRFLVCTRPFALKKTVLYTVVDLRESVRGPDDRVFCEGYETPEDCRARLRDLQLRKIEVSHRHRIPLAVARVARPARARSAA